MNVVRIRKLKNPEAVIEYLSKLVKEDKETIVQMSIALEHNLPTEEYYVIIENGNIVPAYLHRQGDMAIWLWVHPDYRGKGYGAFLVRSLNIKETIALESAVPFWQKMGFKKMSTRTGAVLMRK